MEQNILIRIRKVIFNTLIIVPFFLVSETKAQKEADLKISNISCSTEIESFGGKNDWIKVNYTISYSDAFCGVEFYTITIFDGITIGDNYKPHAKGNPNYSYSRSQELRGSFPIPNYIKDGKHVIVFEFRIKKFIYKHTCQVNIKGKNIQYLSCEESSNFVYKKTKKNKPELDITIVTNKEIYMPNELLVINGNWSSKNEFLPAYATIEIFIEGSSIHRITTTKPSDYFVNIDLTNIDPGIYSIEAVVTAPNSTEGRTTTSITVGVQEEDDLSKLEDEFIKEIAKINSDISVINRLAKRKDIVESFGSAQILCDKLRRYQGDQYFSRTLKKIRGKNPGFSFSITPLAEEVTREYWIKMRNRANHAYRNAMEAYRGCVWNEGIQQAGVVEIPFAYAKLTYDLVNMWSDMCSKKLYGTLQKIHKAYQDPSKSLRPIMLISEDILAGGNDAYDWKTYAGIVGGAISGWDNFWKAWAMVEQYNVQGELIQANRQSAQQLIKSGKNLLQQFDRYRAFIDSHSSSIDCLRDKIMRIDFDNKTIKGENNNIEGGDTKISIWGTGLYDWTGDEFLNIITESGEDLKNEYIYCEDFVKVLQLTVAQADKDYHTVADKIRSSGAVQSQINAQLSQNETNYNWFGDEVSRLKKKYTHFCENESNTYPDDVIIVSNKVVPSVEDQDVNPNDPHVWKYEDEKVYEPINDPKLNTPKQNNNNNNNNNTTITKTSSSRIILKGNGWSAQKIENNPTAIQNDITNAINSGKTPAGIYISESSEVVVYYIEGNPLDMTAWNLENYYDATSLQNGISSYINNGYFPMGISFTNQGKLYVLFIKSQVKATAWRLVESQLDLNVVSTNMQPWLDQQYVPVGITVYNNMYYTLMTQIPDTKITNWTIEGYQDNNNEIMQNVNAKINSGLLPFGFLKEGEIVNILYVGF